MRQLSISISMNSTLWTNDPERAYTEWRHEEAAGADRRAFSEQSIVQHLAMFARFHRYLVSHRRTVATYGADQVDAFFEEIATDCAPGTTTHIRYLKLIDRFTRHLVAIDERKDNPAAEMLTRWTLPGYGAFHRELWQYGNACPCGSRRVLPAMCDLDELRRTGEGCAISE